MASTIKRDALIQQHAALGRTPSFVLRPRKPRPPLLVDSALSDEASPSMSCPQFPTSWLSCERPQEYWGIARPFYRLARLPSPQSSIEMVTPLVANPTDSRKDHGPVSLKTSKLMRYYGPYLLSLIVSTLDIGQLEQKMNLIAKRVLGAWRLCASGKETERWSEREGEGEHAYKLIARASSSSAKVNEN